MPTVYDPNEPMFTLIAHGYTFGRVIRSALFWLSIAFYLACFAYSIQLSSHERAIIRHAVAYPAALFTTLFSFMLGLFTNNCYTRYQDNWRCAVTGLTRLNDLSVQVFATVTDHSLACDIMRLMHAANHLCYGAFAGRGNDMKLVQRRNLVTAAEAKVLARAAGPSAFNLCASWALELVNQATCKPQMFIAMESSIREWRQATARLPLIQVTPLPLPYYRVMIFLVLVFEFVVALCIIVSFDPTGLVDSDADPDFNSNNDHYDNDPTHIVHYEALLLSLLLFLTITVIVQAVVISNFLFLNPWADDALALPAEEYLLLPLSSARKLFRAPRLTDVPGGTHGNVQMVAATAARTTSPRPATASCVAAASTDTPGLPDPSNSRPEAASPTTLAATTEIANGSTRRSRTPLTPRATRLFGHHSSIKGDAHPLVAAAPLDDGGVDLLPGLHSSAVKPGASSPEIRSSLKTRFAADTQPTACQSNHQAVNNRLPQATTPPAPVTGPTVTATKPRRPDSIFLNPLHPADEAMLQKLSRTETAKAREIVAKTFRRLSDFGNESIRQSKIAMGGGSQAPDAVRVRSDDEDADDDASEETPHALQVVRPQRAIGVSTYCAY